MAIRAEKVTVFDRDAVVERSTPHISIVSPVFMGEASVDELVKQVREQTEKITQKYEIILVEDGSLDDSWYRIEEACKRDRRVKGIRLSRNFGQTRAVTAGLEASQGDYVVVLDCDLQDDPKYIPKMYKAARDGFDIVYSLKDKRRHPALKNILSLIFHRLRNLLISNDQLMQDNRCGAYTLLTRQVVNVLLSFHEQHLSYLGALRWMGFRSTYVKTEHRERAYGRSSYTFSKLFRLAEDVITADSDKLLYFSIIVGLSCFAMSLIGAAYIIVAYFVHGFREGWASISVVILFSTGMILMSLGIMGIYVGKTLDQARDRPLYLVRERVNFGEEVESVVYARDLQATFHTAVQE